MNKSKRLRYLSYAIVAYMLMAFSWWSVLLITKNRDAFNAKTELLRLKHLSAFKYESEEAFLVSEPYLTMKENYSNQEVMIIGEAMVILAGIIIGIFMINRGYTELVKGERAKRNFLLSISHELKSPIASIRLALETLQKRTLDRDHITSVADQALEETDRLHGLVNNLLLAVKMETGYQPILDEHDVGTIVESILNNQRRVNPDCSIQAHMDLGREIFVIDKTALQSVLTNLIENAIKYSADMAHVELNLSDREGYLEIIVKDRGMGIPDDEKDKVFEKFYRLGEEQTRKTKGTGLGLYIVHKMVSANHGKISVRDNLPKGSIFEVQLPYKMSVDEHAYSNS